jgi:hypothetical protein
MRLEGISSIADANKWLPCFIEQFNRKFAKMAFNSGSTSVLSLKQPKN